MGDAQPMKGRRVVLFPASSQGHLTPMLQLANILYERGFSITIICTPFVSLSPARHPHFTWLPISTGLSPEEASRLDVFRQLGIQNDCVEPFTECLGRVIGQSPAEERVACLISDALLPFTRAVADGFKLPRITLRTSGASSFLPLDEWCRLRNSGLLPSDAPGSDKALPDFPPLRFKDLPTFNSPEQDKVIYKILDDMMREIRVSSGLICNTFDELEERALALIRRRVDIPCFAIGPLHKLSPRIHASMLEEDASVIPWLDSQPPKSVVYVSFGSIAALHEKGFVEVAWGLVNSGRPFLFVLRSGLVPGSVCPDGIPDHFPQGRGVIVNWAPQTKVLAHAAVGAFCTHTGWNSTVESICEGVPMICLPCFADQKANARYVEEVWKIGVYVEKGPDRGEIERAIRRVMEGTEGQEMRARLAQLKENAHLSLQPGGSSALSLDNLVNYILSF